MSDTQWNAVPRLAGAGAGASAAPAPVRSTRARARATTSALLACAASLVLGGPLACHHVRLDDAGSAAEGVSAGEAASLAAAMAGLVAGEVPRGEPLALDGAAAAEGPLPAALERALDEAGCDLARGPAAAGAPHRLRYRVVPELGGVLVRLSLDWRLEATRLYRRGPDGLVAQAAWAVGRWE